VCGCVCACRDLGDGIVLIGGTNGRRTNSRVRRGAAPNDQGDALGVGYSGVSLYPIDVYSEAVNGRRWPPGRAESVGPFRVTRMSYGLRVAAAAQQLHRAAR